LISTQARKVAFAWRHGDCLLIENATAMHARATFTGPRRILACMAGNLDDA
jgi:alpha-ketoglutarate-dependent taurine dioxygenase